MRRPPIPIGAPAIVVRRPTPPVHAPQCYLVEQRRVERQMPSWNSGSVKPPASVRVGSDAPISSVWTGPGAALNGVKAIPVRRTAIPIGAPPMTRRRRQTCAVGAMPATHAPINKYVRTERAVNRWAVRDSSVKLAKPGKGAPASTPRPIGASPPRTSVREEYDNDSRSERVRGSMWRDDADDDTMEWIAESEEPEDFHVSARVSDEVIQKWLTGVVVDECDL